MKDFPRYLFYVTLGLVLMLPARQQAQAQESCTYRSVNVQIFPLGNDRSALQEAIRSNTQNIIGMMNRGNDSAFDGIDVRSSDEGDLANACSLHPRYKILVLPLLSDDQQRMYEVRGLHLANIDRPEAQMSLIFDHLGNPTAARIVDENERGLAWNALSSQVMEDPNGPRILTLIQQLQDAYNDDALAVASGTASTMENVARLLSEATINVSKLKNNRVQRIPYNPSSGYIRALTRLIRGASGAPKITYELVHMYPHVDEQGNKSDTNYRVTLIQHWRFPPGGYLDTDYLSLDINLNNGSPIASRNAGRGSFNIYSRPRGIDIVEFDSQDWSGLNRKTQYEAIVNAPGQYHYMTLDNVWFKREHVIAWPDSVLNRRDIWVDMEHLPGQIVLNVIPEARNATFLVNGENERDVVNGRTIMIPVSELGNVPGPDDDASDINRTVRIDVLHQDLEPNTFFSETITLTSPEPYTLNIPFPTGTLAVGSSPEPSSVWVNGSEMGPTRLEQEMNVTPADSPLMVQVTNEACLPGELETDCVMHIPSEVRPVAIVSQQTSEEMFYLKPFIVRNETGAGKITAYPIMRNDNLVTVRYHIEDSRDRNRKFFVDFDMMNGATGGKVSDLEGEVTCAASGASSTACVGKNIRPGEFEFTWDMSNYSDNMDNGYVPVLALRKKSPCWPCVLIPAAAGVAAAYIWPRTGSNETPDGFVPPPRPSETQNR